MSTSRDSPSTSSSAPSPEPPSSSAPAPEPSSSSIPSPEPPSSSAPAPEPPSSSGSGRRPEPPRRGSAPPTESPSSSREPLTEPYAGSGDPFSVQVAGGSAQFDAAVSDGQMETGPSSMSAGSASDPLESTEFLGRAGAVRLWLALTDEPWSLDLDTAVISASPDGLGNLGRGLFGTDEREPDFQAILSVLTPTNPRQVLAPGSAAATAPALRQVVLVSARPAGGTSTEVKPATVRAAVQATRSSIGLAIQAGARRLGVPLLGAGAAGLSPEAVAGPAVAAARSAASAANAALTDVCFLVYDEAAANAIRAAAVEYRTQPVVNDRAMGEDLLEIRDEVQALADMILLRDVQPPLAIGVLGGWGSGKSFVMNLMRERIETIRAQTLTATEAWGDSGVSPFVGHVYPIEFNAWTYARADLWAALMQRVLSELDRQVGIERRLLAKSGDLLDGAAWKQLFELPDNLHRLYDEVPTAGVIDLFSALERAHLEDRERLLDKQRDLASLRGTELMQRRAIEAKVDSEIKMEVDDARWRPFRQLAADAVGATAAEVNEWIRRMPSGATALADGEQSVENIRALSSVLQVLRPPDRRVARTVVRRNLAAAIVFVVAAIGTPLLVGAVHDWFDGGAVPAAAAGLIASLGAGARLVRAWSDTTRRFADQVTRWRQQVDEEVVHIEQMRDQLVDVKVLQSEQLQETRAKIRSVEQEVARLRERAELVGQFDSLGSLVAARLEAGTYRERLGVMQDIADDLRSLSRSLTITPNDIHADDKRKVFPRGPARVVLFIDDIDRCPPAKVVEILEAVQLLLATDLFVVVIALDVRYVTKALEKVYEGVLAQNGDPSGLDYLEKIIQVPYRTRSMGVEAARQFVLGHTTAASSASTPAVGGPLPGATEETGPTRNEIEEMPSPAAVATELLFTDAEQGVIATCCGLLELSPRAAKRVVNICKIFRMVYARRGIANPPLEQTATVAMLVGLAAAHPEIQRDVLRMLETSSVTDSTVAQRLDEFADQDDNRTLFVQWKASWQRFSRSAEPDPPIPQTFRFGSERLVDTMDTLRFVSSFCFVAEAA